MKISEEGLQLIESAEGLRLDAYPDPGTGGEPITIGIGHTGGVKLGDHITAEEAREYLRRDLDEAEDVVRRRVNVKLTQGQFDALVSFVFNVGPWAFAGSTLLRKLNARDYAGAAAEFGRWTHAAGKVLPGLVKRRAAERELFLKE